MSDKTYIPLLPLTDATAKPVPLSDQEKELHPQLLQHFTDPSYKIPGIGADAELTEAEKFWLSHECILRYLRASKWKTGMAIQRLDQTLKWRRDFGLYDTVSESRVEPEAVTGKEILFGYDTNGRPAFYMIPSRQNTDEATRQIQFAVWMLERSVDLMSPGVENIDLLINFADKAKNPSLSTARTVLNILQDHYPERLGLALISNVPFLVHAFFKLITPFIDPITRAKMKFNPQAVKDGIFTADNLMSEWGGSHNFEYDHEQYWPALVNLCEDRRKAWMQKWRSLGGKVGLREWDYKRGADDGGSDDEPVEVLASPENKESEEATNVDRVRETIKVNGTEETVEGEKTTEGDKVEKVEVEEKTAKKAEMKDSVVDAKEADSVSAVE